MVSRLTSFKLSKEKRLFSESEKNRKGPEHYEKGKGEKVRRTWRRLGGGWVGGCVLRRKKLSSMFQEGLEGILFKRKRSEKREEVYAGLEA